MAKHVQQFKRSADAALCAVVLGLSACSDGDEPAREVSDAESTTADAVAPGTDAELASASDAAMPRDAGERLPNASGAGLDAARADAKADTATDAARVDAAGDAQSDAALCATAAGAPELDVTQVSALAAEGGPARKGEPLALTLVIENRSAFGAMVRVTPRLDSLRFSDYTGVPLAQTTVLLCPGTNTVRVVGGPFLSHDQKAKHYALGSGEYQVASVTLEVAGMPSRSDSDLEGARFRVQTSNALLVPVMYDARYFEQIQGIGNTKPEAYLTRAFSRKNEIFTPTGSDPDGAGSYQSFAQGFDEMMNVRHRFKLFPGFPGAETTSDGWCEDAAAYAASTLGMAAAWDARPAQTRPERHGFDYLMALTPDMGGGVACGWLDVQVSSFIGRDLDRQQVIAVHETGHIFGAPHCDDVGNGSGGSLQGYVMCSGERHVRYPDAFVWHASSRMHMRSHWD